MEILGVVSFVHWCYNLSQNQETNLVLKLYNKLKLVRKH